MSWNKNHINSCPLLSFQWYLLKWLFIYFLVDGLWKPYFFWLFNICTCVHIMSPFSDEVLMFYFVKTFFDKKLDLFGMGFNMPFILNITLILIIQISWNYNFAQYFNSWWYFCFLVKKLCFHVMEKHLFFLINTSGIFFELTYFSTIKSFWKIIWNRSNATCNNHCWYCKFWKTMTWNDIYQNFRNNQTREIIELSSSKKLS